MKQEQKEFISAAPMALLVWWFLAECFSGTIHSRELNQMFLFTWEYFREVCFIPGGLAEYAGRFLNQFFYHPVAGAAIYAALIWLIQHLLWKNMVRNSGCSLGLSILVFAAVTWYVTSENAVTGTLVSMAVILYSLKIAEKLNWSNILLTLVLFAISGPISIIFPVAVWIKTGHHSTGAACLVTGLISCAAYMAVTPGEFVPELYILPASAIILLAADKFITIRKKRVSVTATLICAAITLAAYFPCRKSIPELEENFFEYEYMEEREQWDEIIERAEAEMPENALSMQIINLAYAQKGTLLENAFKYKRNRCECLWTTEADHHVFPLGTAEILFYLDKPNLSQQYWFDLMQSIPDRQKSSRAYRRIAECNALSGNTETAIKYASALSHTLFYRKWAKNFRPVVKSGYSDNDFFYDLNFENMLIKSFRRRNNRMAFQYAVLNALMHKDLETMVKLSDGLYINDIPDCCQQALILSWLQHGGNPDNFPEWIDKQNKKTFQAFDKSKRDGWSANRMYNKYKGSYLFYYVYYKL